MTTYSIECQELTKTFSMGKSTVHALTGINLQVKSDELLMLVGPSGSGKTTLLSVMAGLLGQTNGECMVLGKDIHNLPGDELVHFRGANLGFIFQAFNLIPALTSTENVMVPLLLQNVDRIEAEERAVALLHKLGLSDKVNALPAELSGGQQQRVSIARGCIHKPRIILCDEPTSFLDNVSGQQVVELLKEIQAETDCTVIVVTHDPRIQHFADRILTIEDGKIADQKINGREDDVSPGPSQKD